MIDADRIAPRLYQGSAPPLGTELRRAGFDMLVLMAEEHQPDARAFDGIAVVHGPIDDAELTELEWQHVVRAARIVARRHQSGGRILVTCMAGLNRSGITTALALHLLTGCSGKDAVKIVQARRDFALGNKSFVRRLAKIPPTLLARSDYHTSGNLIGALARADALR